MTTGDSSGSVTFQARSASTVSDCQLGVGLVPHQPRCRPRGHAAGNDPRDVERTRRSVERHRPDDEGLPVEVEGVMAARAFGRFPVRIRVRRGRRPTQLDADRAGRPTVGCRGSSTADGSTPGRECQGDAATSPAQRRWEGIRRRPRSSNMPSLMRPSDHVQRPAPSTGRHRRKISGLAEVLDSGRGRLK